MSDTLAESRGLLILPRLRVQNANAISSPFTHGFPAITAFLGLMWALERKLAGRYPLFFTGVGVICHHHEEQVATAGFTRAFRLTRNPIDKDGSTAAIVEEGRIHLDITLVFGVSGTVLEADWAIRRECADQVAAELAQMRIAGGTVLPGAAAGIHATRPHLEAFPDAANDRPKWFSNLRRRWLPGFALVARDDLLADRLAQLRRKDATATTLDAWLDLVRLNCMPPPQDETAATEKKTSAVEWIYEKKPGWIVPIPVGYGALTPLQTAGSVRNARDATTPFRFVESLYSIGQWIAPHRLDSWRQLLWYGHSDIETGRYRACNDYIAATSTHPH
ncbi:CRISPR-associated Csy2 family protein [Tahibacter aquaticus]|uniref:CRISPR-associated Csy2 family protein n=1 Tax=Tahibacter aquaticus TaxID=520092 RepID=A0A4R6Z7G8_9GAMM|nr:type I-F CRISPR-associated protein Csy2 [Tahibacter aquaticus]TDR47715.1 CRISPR-associated Csy2 family protein [Tahibacter aquaticus]